MNGQKLSRQVMWAILTTPASDARRGTDRNGMAFASAGALVEMDNILGPPTGLAAVGDDDVGRMRHAPAL